MDCVAKDVPARAAAGRPKKHTTWQAKNNIAQDAPPFNVGLGPLTTLGGEGGEAFGLLR